MNAVLSALANGLVLSAPGSGGLWLAMRLLKRSFNAATRYAIWWIALLAMVALPVFYPMTAANRRAIEPKSTSDGTTGVAATPSEAPSSNSTFTAGLAASTKSSWLSIIPIHVPSSPWTERFGELWALISLLLVARLAAGFAALHSQKKYSREAPSELLELMERCLTGRGMKRRVRLALVPEGSSPMLAGAIRPCVLIPERFLSALDRAELEQIFLHEANHAARYDDWALLLQRVIQAVFVLYPVVHYVARQISLEREAASDANVIVATGDPRAYAKCLTHVAEFSVGYWKSPLAAAIGDEKSYLTRRILTVLDKNRHIGKGLLTIRLALAGTVVCLLAVLAATSPAFFVSAQSPDTAISEKAAGEKLSFEVASIKPVDKQALNFIGLNVYPGGRVVIPDVTLKELIGTAFDVNPWQISGGENWTDTTPFNVEAKAPSNLAGRINLRHSWFHMEDPSLRLMLQSLLINRFQLKLHTQTKTGTVYLLERNGKGSPLQPAKTDNLFQSYGQGYSEVAPQGGVWDIANASMAQVANFLSTYILHAPVLDKTGLSGTFDFRSKSQPDFGQNQQDFGASLLSGLGEMGLKLKQEKGPVDYLVIDYAEKPSPN